MTTSNLPTTLPRFFWHFLSRYKPIIAGLIMTGLFSGITMSITPYILKMIIDRVALYQTNPSDVIQAVKYLAILYVSLWGLTGANYRFVDWLKLRLFPNIL